MRRACFFAIFIIRVVYAGEIITTNDFGDIERECQTLNPNSLALFDVDATLIVPDDAILQPKAKVLFEELVSVYTDRDLFREIRMKAPHSLVDGRSVGFVRKLQQQKVPVIALTAAPAKIKGSECPGNWRVDELRRFGFDFQGAFPQSNCIVLPKSDRFEHFPMFKMGVLYSSFHAKGDTLIIFLQVLNVRPEKVIFVDDELRHVKSVVSCLDKVGIPCVGIHYVTANEAPCELNPELGLFQIEHFVKNDLWINDKEGQDILASGPDNKGVAAPN